MACDIRIAAESAVVAESFVKLDLISGFGGSWLLPQIAGASRAAEMSFIGDPVDARTAAACGLVSKVAAPDALMQEATGLAQCIAANPAAALRMAKRLLWEGATLGFEATLEMAAGFQAAAHASQDHQEALLAASEKRNGHYAGR